MHMNPTALNLEPAERRRASPRPVPKRLKKSRLKSVGPLSLDELRKLAQRFPPPQEWYDADEGSPFGAATSVGT